MNWNENSRLQMLSNLRTAKIQEWLRKAEDDMDKTDREVEKGSSEYSDAARLTALTTLQKTADNTIWESWLRSRPRFERGDVDSFCSTEDIDAQEWEEELEESKRGFRAEPTRRLENLSTHHVSEVEEAKAIHVQPSTTRRVNFVGEGQHVGSKTSKRVSSIAFKIHIELSAGPFCHPGATTNQGLGLRILKVEGVCLDSTGNRVPCTVKLACTDVRIVGSVNTHQSANDHTEAVQKGLGSVVNAASVAGFALKLIGWISSTVILLVSLFWLLFALSPNAPSG